LIDREQQEACPGQIATLLEQEFGRKGTNLAVRVALKDRTFENWLIADLGALQSQPARFAVTAAISRCVEPDKADRCDAEKIIKKAAANGQYDKITDAERISTKLDIESAARNSRSFRHFLHILGHSSYRSQCRLPSP